MKSIVVEAQTFTGRADLQSALRIGPNSIRQRKSRLQIGAPLRLLAFTLLALALCPAAQSQPANSSTNSESELYRKLKALPGVVEVRETPGNSPAFKESYEVMFEQPLDHQNPGGEKFRQRFPSRLKSRM